jgi:UDP-N-acetylmuramoylalanine--D-glutamate ligase
MNNSKITILGAGESGTGAAILAKMKGHDVFVSDYSEIKPKYKALLNENNIHWEEKQHSADIILASDEIIKSPGIADTTPIITQILDKNIHIISEIEFAARYTNSPKICITGSNGKTTTTTLIHHILQTAGINAGMAGNVGSSFALQVAQSPRDVYVLELSSFQLDNMYDFKAEIAILLNITPDHLDRYDHSMQRYAESKFRITRNQTPSDTFIYWNDDPLIHNYITDYELYSTNFPFALNKKNGVKAYTENKMMIIETKNGNFYMETGLLSLSGEHNLYNSLAASIAAKAMNISDEKIRAALSSFKGVNHRLEYVTRVKGVDYINDSKATNVNSCWYALKSIRTKIVLILGGQDKGNDYSEIEPVVREKVHALIFLGVDNSKLHSFFDGMIPIIEDARSMPEAVNKAYAIAEKGQTVLLSPCCASFDLFKNYEDRGDQFKHCALNL